MNHLKRSRVEVVQNLPLQERLELPPPSKKVKLTERSFLAKKSGKHELADDDIVEVQAPNRLPTVDEMGLYACGRCLCRFERNVLLCGLCKFCWLQSDHATETLGVRFQHR